MGSAPKKKAVFALSVGGLWMPPSSFDKLRMRTTVGLGSHKILILSLSKDEDFLPRQSPTLNANSAKEKGPGVSARASFQVRVSET